MAIGTVKWFNARNGYGFIIPSDGGADVFAHFSAIDMRSYKGLKEGETVEYELSGYKGLKEGEIVEYELTEERGVQASNIKVVLVSE